MHTLRDKTQHQSAYKAAQKHKQLTNKHTTKQQTPDHSSRLHD